MKTITKAVSVLFLGSVLCLAETWSGKVVDAACKDQAATPAPSAQSAQPGARVANACEPTASTVAFGIELSDGTVLKLDGSGKAKVVEAMKPNAGESSLTDKVKGSLVPLDGLAGASRAKGAGAKGRGHCRWEGCLEGVSCECE